MENKEERIKEIENKLKRIEESSDYDDEEYDNYLDDVTDAQYLIDTYGASRILKVVDEVVYNVGKGEYWNNRVYELEEELEELKGGLKK